MEESEESETRLRTTRYDLLYNSNRRLNFTNTLFCKCVEEVPLYTPKGKRNLAQPSQYPPGWHPSVAASTTTTTKTKAQKPKPPAAVEKTNSQAIEKLKAPADKSKQTAEKSKIKEKKDVAPKADPVDDINEKLQDASIDPTVEISKRLKRLRRRLRESEQLEEKINLARTAGEPTNPDQIEKCSRRKELEDEINQLEDERNKLRQLKANKNT